MMFPTWSVLRRAMVVMVVFVTSEARSADAPVVDYTSYRDGT